MGYIGAIAVLILTPVLWILSHKYFRFIYFGNIGKSILKELLECFFISIFLISVLGAIFVTIFGVSGDSEKEQNSQEAAFSANSNDGSYNTSENPTNLDKIIAEFQEIGYVDSDDIFSVLTPALPNTFTPVIAEQEVYMSPLASLKSNNSPYDGYDNLFNWEYPLTFQREREEIFEILSAIDGVALQIDGKTVSNRNDFIPVEEYEYGTYQQITPYGDDGISIVYYGEFSDSRPNGVGVLLSLYESGVIPIYAGHFENGLIKGYGMRLSGYNGIQSEGYFDYTTRPIDFAADGPFDTEGSYGNIQGQGIVYYREYDITGDLDNGINEALWDRVKYDEDYYYDDSMRDTTREYTVISNYPVQRPRVHHEGTYELGNLREGSEYYYVKDQCYGALKSSGSYQDDLIHSGIFRCPDGTCLKGAFRDSSEFIGGIYYPSGQIRFAGTLFDFGVGIDDIEQMEDQMNYADFPYNIGTLYGEDGAIQGTVMDGNFRWS